TEVEVNSDSSRLSTSLHKIPCLLHSFVICLFIFLQEVAATTKKDLCIYSLLYVSLINIRFSPYLFFSSENFPKNSSLITVTFPSNSRKFLAFLYPTFPPPTITI